MDEIVLEHFSSVLVDAPWLPTVVIDVEVAAIGFLDLGLLHDLLATNKLREASWGDCRRPSESRLTQGSSPRASHQLRWYRGCLGESLG